MALRLGLVTNGADGAEIIAAVREAEQLGFDSTWCGESYGVDAVTRLAWIGGQTTRIRLGASILQIPARAPALTAMTAMTLDRLTGGRFILGLGPSGPQVVEGWYGVPYGKPLARMREYMAIVRAVFAREAPLTHQGEHSVRAVSCAGWHHRFYSGTLATFRRSDCAYQQGAEITT